MVGDGGVGVDDDGGHFVVSDLLQQRSRVQTVVQHPHRQRFPGDEEAADQLLQSQQAYGGGVKTYVKLNMPTYSVCGVKNQVSGVLTLKTGSKKSLNGKIVALTCRKRVIRETNNSNSKNV